MGIGHTHIHKHTQQTAYEITLCTYVRLSIGYPAPCAWLWAYTSRGKISRGRSPRLIFPRDVYAHNHKQGAGYPAYTTVIQLTVGAPSNRGYVDVILAITDVLV